MAIGTSMMPATVVTLPPGDQMPGALKSSSAAASTGSSTLSESDFLTLLTTQLKNQDPLNPQSPSDLAAELAQFSTASGVQNLNSSFGTTSGMQAAGLVGKNVAVSGNALVLGASGSAEGAFNLSAPASDVGLTIANSAGRVVAMVDLGAKGAGNQNFVWNGQGPNGTALPAGNYSYAISAMSATKGVTETATPYAVVPVTAVVLGGSSGPMLNLGGGLSPVALSAVQEVF